MSGRDPFPPKRFENDFTLGGFRPQQTKSGTKPTHIAQMEEPWSGLHDAQTAASSRRSVFSLDHEAPRDSLDFQLKSIYDHHSSFLWSKNQVFYQKETVSEEPRNRKQTNAEKQDQLKDKDIRVWVDPKRCSIHSIK